MIETILFLDDLVFWFEIGKWVILAMVAYFYYKWAQDHLAFSPVLTLAVAAILVYYLVIENPIIGTLGWIGWVLISSGVLYLLPYFMPLVFKRKPF